MEQVYKAPDGSRHVIDPAFEHRLPAGSIAVTPEEDAALWPQPIPPNPRIAELKAQILAIDLKRIRPLAEGDTEYLATLNAQLLPLRAELEPLL